MNIKSPHRTPLQNRKRYAAVNIEKNARDYDSFDPGASFRQRLPDSRLFVISRTWPKVFAIRGAAYFSDAEHVYAKHFDGNDFLLDPPSWLC